MCRRRHSSSGLRRAFTLVEMLVVLSLILVLAALGIAFIPRVTERQKTGRAAEQSQQQALGKELPGQTPGARANSSPDRNFPLPSRCSGQQQAR